MDEIILLGTKGGPAIRQGGALPTASVLRLAGRTMLIDCAIGAARSAVEAGVGLLQIDDIFITHLHSDHVLELGPLIYTAWTTGLQRSITVYGPPGIAEYWEGFLASMAFDYRIRLADEGRPPLTDLVQIKTYGPGEVMRSDTLIVDALRVDHPPVTDCFALRFATAGTVVVFSSDTCYFPPLGDFARGADVLVHEAMLTDGVEALIKRTPGASRLREHLYASHTRAEDVGRIASSAGVGHLVLNHLLPADDPNFSQADWHAAIQPTWAGPLTVGRDGLRIPLS
jgi:ribonuclease BN (tRNA processing enzyme)